MSMACPKCGHVRTAVDPPPETECPKCGIIYAKYRPPEDIVTRAKRTRDWSNVPPNVFQSTLKSMVVTTTPMLPGTKIEEVLDVVTAEVAFGMNLFRDFFASVTDIAGGRSQSTQNVLRDARKKAIDELKKEALAVGADAVVGVDLNYSEFSGGGKSMLFIVASGTAVRATKASDG